MELPAKPFQSDRNALIIKTDAGKTWKHLQLKITGFNQQCSAGNILHWSGGVVVGSVPCRVGWYELGVGTVQHGNPAEDYRVQSTVFRW